MSPLGVLPLLPLLGFLGIVVTGLVFVLRQGLTAPWARLALSGLALLGASALLTLWLSGSVLAYAPTIMTESTYRALGSLSSLGNLAGLGLLVASAVSGRPDSAQPLDRPERTS
jgi:hypothetical protein